MMSKFKKFLGVYFGSGPRNSAKQWQIVPREWITDGGKKPYCYWPPDGDVEWLARTCTSPNPATWSKFIISRIAEESDDFARCERKMVRGDVSHTDISASESEKKKGLTRSTHFSGSGVSQLVQGQHTFQVTNCSQVPGVNRVDSSSDESDHIEGDRLSNLARPLTSRTGLLAKKIENPSNSSCTCCPDHKQDILATLRSLKSICADTNMVVNEIRDRLPANAKPLVWPNRRPASTLEELDGLVSTEELIERLAGAERSSLQSTVRGMMKLLLTKDLAHLFSFTGMDSRRQNTKESFKDHEAYERIMAALKQTRFVSAKRPEVNKSIMNALKNAPDWEGGRDHRVRRRPAIPTTSTEVHEKDEGSEGTAISSTPRRSPRVHNATHNSPIHDVYSKAIRLLEL